MIKSLLALVACVQLVAAESQLRLLHRVYLPLTGPSPFSERGTVLFKADSEPIWLPSDTVLQDWQSMSRLVQASEDGALYQIALQYQPHNQEDLDISSVKACHLAQSTSETIVLHLTHEAETFALDYFVQPIPHDGSCPSPTGKSPNPSELHLPRAFLNMTVVIKSPAVPPIPILRMPPPLSPEGEVIPLVPEKSFIQKYWMYIFAIVLAMMITPSPDHGEATAR